jgi:hypothetical protein
MLYFIIKDLYIDGSVQPIHIYFPYHHITTWTLMWVLINWLNERTVHSVAGVLDEHYSQQTPLSGVAIQASRIGNFRPKKIIPRKIRRNNWFVPAEFWQFHRTENSRNSVPNHSAEEKNAENSVRGTKIEANSRIPFSGTQIEANTWNSVPNHSGEEKTTRNSESVE